MKHSISRRNFLSRIGAAGFIAGAVLPITARARESDDWLDDHDDYFVDQMPSTGIPDPTHIRRKGRGWRLRPTGSDDHDNLEWALRNTARGGTVKRLGRAKRAESPAKESV